ncbi:unnamed protein product [Dovyalis caffra]|uniref:Uncharacterized protein n=1 Tax=Dovyalis caffra TaxID=77055 RepID=A0AAV1RL12_9ROSI|nr:unnamed protein product [Dovyalis caffra]
MRDLDPDPDPEDDEAGALCRGKQKDVSSPRRILSYTSIINKCINEVVQRRNEQSQGENGLMINYIDSRETKFLIYIIPTYKGKLVPQNEKDKKRKEKDKALTRGMPLVALSSKNLDGL